MDGRIVLMDEDGIVILPEYDHGDDDEPSALARVAAWAVIIVGGVTFGGLAAYGVMRAFGWL